MTKIESKKVTVNAPSDVVFAFVTDLNNLQELLPEGKISDWKSDRNQCSFKVQGGYSISLKMKNSTPNSLVQLKSGSSSPFPFDLNIFIEEAENGCTVYQLCEADINPFLVMIVKTPLQNLFDYMTDRLEKKYAK